METTRTHWKNYTDSEYLGAYSFAGKVDSLILTIKGIEMKEVTAEGNKKDTRPVASFEEKTKNGVEVKPMVLNPTNCKILEAIYKTPYIEDWIGKKISIYVQEDVQVGRSYVPALRIKREIPTFKCSVCEKEIGETLYNGSIKKYGKAYCCKECAEKDGVKFEQVAEVAQNETKE